MARRPGVMMLRKNLLPSGRTAATTPFHQIQRGPSTNAGTGGEPHVTCSRSSRRAAPAPLTAFRQRSQFLLENRVLLMRVFLPFVAGYYLSYLFRTINGLVAAPLALELGF